MVSLVAGGMTGEFSTSAAADTLQCYVINTVIYNTVVIIDSTRSRRSSVKLLDFLIFF